MGRSSREQRDPVANKRFRAGIDSAALWGPVARSGLGRPATHSRDEITAAAVAIADTDGLAAVSIRRVAAAIEAGAMSLYSYVPDKETLIELMIDRVSGEIELVEPSGQPLNDLITYARSSLAMMRCHPWLPGALAARQTLGPSALAGMEHVLAILAPTALDPTTKFELLAVLTGMVANYAQHEVTQGELARRTGRSTAENAAAEFVYLVAAARSGRYPHIAQALLPASSPAAPRSTDPDAVFDRLIERVLAGLLRG
jgi:AcrR family transcriptional regulator